MDINLDGLAMDSRKAAHDHLLERFGFPAYYGRNLDALYDLLTEVRTPTRISLLHKNAMLQALGTYGNALIECFEQAEAENPSSEFHIL